MTSRGLRAVSPQIKTDEIYENTSDNIISITESKATLVFRKYVKAPTSNGIISNLGLAIAFGTPLFTSDFKQFLGLSPEFIGAIFFILMALFTGKFTYSVIAYLKEGYQLTEENFIRELKGQETNSVACKKRRLKKQLLEARRQGLREGYRLGT